MRVSKKLHLMIIPQSTGSVRQYSVPRWVVPGVLAALVLMLLFTVVSGTLAVRHATRTGQLNAQVEQNKALRTQLAGLHADIELLREQLVALEGSEQRVRMVFGLPEIDPAERALGTGGAVAPINGGGLSKVDSETFGVETELDRLLRRCEFERDNFEAIFEALTERKNQLDCTPSICPVDGYLSRGYGAKPDPFTGRVRPHTGIDLAARIGTPVRATADGRVVSVGYQSQLGKLITIDHGYGIKTTYGHLSKYAVKRRALVRRGDVIGYVGNTGYSTGPHLHYEVHVKGRSVNPMKYIYDFSPWVGEPFARHSGAETDAS